jgi:hypothetical protein
MAESYITRKGGGGGAAINGLIESYKVKAGENISAGDFVDYVKGEFTFKNPNVFNTAQTYIFDAITLAPNKIVLFYQDGGNSNYGTAIVGVVNNNTINWGSEIVFNTGSTDLVSVGVLENNKIVIAYRDISNANGYGKSLIGTINDTSITFGSKYTFISTQVIETSLIVINSTKILISFYNLLSGTFGNAVVGTINGTVITFGSSVQFFNNDFSGLSSTLLRTDTIYGDVVVIAYNNQSFGNVAQAVVGKITGTSITFYIDARTNFNTGGTEFTSIKTLETNKVIISFKHTSTNQGNSVIGIIDTGSSGPFIAWGARYVFNAANTTNINSSLIEKNKVLIVYQDAGNSGYGTAIIATISGTIITFGSELIFNQNLTSFIHVKVLDGDKYIITYRDNNNSGNGTALIATFDKEVFPATDQIFGVAKTSGTGGQTIDVYVDETSLPLKIEKTFKSFVVASGQTITAGAFVDYINGVFSIGQQKQINNKRANKIDGVALTNNKFVIIYSEYTPDEVKARVVTINGDEIILGAPVLLLNAQKLDGTVVKINESKVVFLYSNSAVGYQGTARVGEINGNTITLGSSSVFRSNQFCSDVTGVSSLNPNVVHVFYNNYSANRGQGIVGTISGTNITWAGFNEWTTSAISEFKFTLIRPNVGIIAYSIGTAGISCARIGLNTTGFNSSSIISISNQGTSTSGINIRKKDDYTAVVTWGNSFSNNQKLLYFYEVSLSNQDIIRSRTEQITPLVPTDSVNDTSVDWFNENDFVLYYKDSNKRYFIAGKRTNLGTYIFQPITEFFTPSFSNFDGRKTFTVGDKSIFGFNNDTTNIGSLVMSKYIKEITNANNEKVFGLAKTGGTTGQIVEIFANE